MSRRNTGRPRLLSGGAAHEAVVLLTSGQCRGEAAVACELHIKGHALTTLAPSTIIRAAEYEGVLNNTLLSEGCRLVGAHGV